MRYYVAYAYRFLTNNSLSGTIPNWISGSDQTLLVFPNFLFTSSRIVIELMHLILISNPTILHFQSRKFCSNAMTISVVVMYPTTTLQSLLLCLFASKGPCKLLLIFFFFIISSFCHIFYDHCFMIL